MTLRQRGLQPAAATGATVVQAWCPAAAVVSGDDKEYFERPDPVMQRMAGHAHTEGPTRPGATLPLEETLCVERVGIVATGSPVVVPGPHQRPHVVRGELREPAAHEGLHLRPGAGHAAAPPPGLAPRLPSGCGERRMMRVREGGERIPARSPPVTVGLADRDRRRPTVTGGDRP